MIWRKAKNKNKKFTFICVFKREKKRLNNLYTRIQNVNIYDDNDDFNDDDDGY